MSHKNEEQKSRSQMDWEGRQGAPDKDAKKSQAQEKNAGKAFGGGPKRFRRFRQKRERKPIGKRLSLGRGALLWKKKPQRNRPVNSRPIAKSKASPVFGSSALEKEGTASGSMKTGTAKRLIKDGKQLLSGEHRDGQQGEAPEQYAVESIQGKGKKVGEVILQEAARAVKDEMTSRDKSSEGASEQGSTPPHQEARDAEAPAKSEKTETADAADESHRKPDQLPKEDVAERTASEPPSPRGFPTPQNVGTAQPVAVRSSEDKLQALDNALGEDGRKGISVVQNRLHASGNPDSGSSDEGGVLGDRYVARGGTSTSPRRQAFGDGDEFLPDPGTYPEPSITAYDFHPDRELPHRTGGGSGMGELPQPERTKTAVGKVSERESTAELRGPARSRSARESSRNPVREKSPDAVQTRSVDTSVQLGGRARLQTWQNSPISASLNNQVPALASAQGGTAVQAFANQAVMAQAGGGAMAGAAAGAASGGMSFAVQAGVQAVQKLIDQLKEAVRNAAASAGSSAKAWGTGTALLVLPMIFVLSVVCLFRMGGSATNVGLSENVIALMPQIREACQRHGIPEYVPLVAAVMMQESGGNVDLVHGDVMQCAEGMGYPVGTPVPVEESIDFGTSLLADLLRQAGAQGPADLSRISLALQSYNFGGGYLTWALSHYGGYSKENAQEFSDMQAAAMGWSGYGDPLYVDHVLRYYQVTQGGMGDRSAIANGFFAYPFPGHTWNTYAGHEGIDISFSGIEGQPVYASAPGTVSYVQNGYGNLQGSGGMASYGNCVFIDHGNGWESRYAHMTVAVAQRGQYVQEGQLLGYVGNTGNSYGAHLHLALYFNGSPSSGGVIYAEQAWPHLKE